MSTHTMTCHSCHQPVARHEARLMGNGHELLAWHRSCHAPLPQRAARPSLVEFVQHVPAQRTGDHDARRSA